MSSKRPACSNCGGTGRQGTELCPECGGMGREPEMAPNEKPLYIS